MCSVCGCGEGENRLEGPAMAHSHVHADGTVHSYAHDHHHPHDHDHAADLDFGAGPAHAHVPGLTQSRMVQIEQDILAKNNSFARANRQQFDERGILALNLVSSPGSGKTTLLLRTIGLLKDRLAINVVEGDQQTSRDAERIRATGVAALQINTGKGCHLDAQMVGQAMERLAPAEDSLFLIENVGNLVCPAAFDLGEHHKVAILSVTEGEDKPLKYPDMFRAADVLLLNKCDLLPHLEFDVAQAEANARRVNPRLRIVRVSATQGDGLSDWVAWIEAALKLQRLRRADQVAALKRRVAELERLLAEK